MVFLRRPTTAPHSLLLRNCLLHWLTDQLLHCPAPLLGHLHTVHLEGGGALLLGDSVALLEIHHELTGVDTTQTLHLHILTLLYGNTRTLRLRRSVTLWGPVYRLELTGLNNFITL